MPILCTSYLQKAARQLCYFCHQPISYGEFDYAKTKSVRFGGKTFPSKEIYFHSTCWKNSLSKNHS